jgi:hypothetical protein
MGKQRPSWRNAFPTSPPDDACLFPEAAKNGMPVFRHETAYLTAVMGRVSGRQDIRAASQYFDIESTSGPIIRAGLGG